MAFSKQQSRIAWSSLAVMAAMAVIPPWGSRVLESGFVRTVVRYDWLWSPPVGSDDVAWPSVLLGERLLMQWTVVAVGMVLLLFLCESRERTARLRTAPARMADVFR